MSKTLDLDKLEKSVLREKVWVPAELVSNKGLRFAEQVGIENKGAPKGESILLSRKKPSIFEEQDIGTYKLNEDKRTVQLDGKDWHRGRVVDLVGNDELVPAKATERVYLRKLGAWVPRYKVDSNQRHFLKSLRRAQHVIEANQLGAQNTAVNSPQSNKTGLHRVGGSA